MSHQERVHFLQKLRNAIGDYSGFTFNEKLYGLKHINEWIDRNGNLDTFIKKFSEISLDVRPFLKEANFIKA